MTGTSGMTGTSSLLCFASKSIRMTITDITTTEKTEITIFFNVPFLG